MSTYLITLPCLFVVGVTVRYLMPRLGSPAGSWQAKQVAATRPVCPRARMRRSNPDPRQKDSTHAPSIASLCKSDQRCLDIRCCIVNQSRLNSNCMLGSVVYA